MDAATESYSSLVGVAVGGKYEIRRVIGAGGMGVVCEALHLDLHKRVAIKLIDKTMKESEMIVTRFRREAKAAGQINSDHIVDVFDVGADARVGLYMVMEYLTGEDLQSRLERDKRIDVKTGVMIAHQIARALAKAHEAGVIHRDLKPANVFLTQRDNGQLLVKLLDFGVSKVLDEEGAARITGSGAPIGTPLYMAPEQAEGKDDVDGRADIWSLGALVYEAFAGVPPFPDRGSYHSTIVGILTSRPKLLHDVAPWIPPELASVVDAMLVHDRDARIPNALSVAQRLLTAFPSVLPDGTGKFTAVIVAQAAAAVDATGDTELFTSESMRRDARRQSHPQSGRPPSRPPPSHPPSYPPLTTGRSDPPTMPEAGSEARQTGAASPVDYRHRQGPPSVVDAPPRSRSGMTPEPDFDRTQKTHNPLSTGGPRTAPLLPPSSSRPESLGFPPAPHSRPGLASTPPAIDPLPASEPPPSRRKRQSTVRMETRRSKAPWLIAFVVVAGVAVGGFFVGRKTTLLPRYLPFLSEPKAAPAPPAEPRALPSTTASSAPVAPVVSAATSTSASTSAAPPVASESPLPSAKPTVRKPRPRPVTKPEPGPPEDPFVEP